MSFENNTPAAEMIPRPDALNVYISSTSRLNRIFSGECMDLSWVKNSLAKTKSVKVQHLVQEVINLKRLEEASEDGMKTLAMAVIKVMQELKSIKQWSPNWNSILIHLACCKMDADSREEWNSCSGTSPTFTQLLQFLMSCMPSESKTPSSENGIFSGKYMDFTLIRKSLAQAKSVHVRRLVQDVINLRRLQETSDENLQTLVDALCEVMLELRKTEKWTPDWDMVLMHLACCKMDATTRRHWNSCSGKSPTFAKLLMFLEK